MLCGTFGRHKDHLRHVANVIGLQRGASIFAAMNVLILPNARALHLRHLRERGSRAPSNWRRSP